MIYSFTTIMEGWLAGQKIEDGFLLSGHRTAQPSMHGGKELWADAQARRSFDNIVQS